ncbi:hypothetical protein [Carboxylicivirga linearis]|uniref:Uncharacterized protein n=1 Tax=Carboxylicivirga linearis TaxID=1628157 RepID=A0ABS5K087_9BACT|nr:hypothetical protein [Carboxylicivirga linearis]MBS2100574.1 hypothetical protein [Carboxylicivirga linearis]
MKNKPNFTYLLRKYSFGIVLLILALLVYLIYYVLIFNDHCQGKVYGDHVSVGGNYKTHSLKYCYQHKGITYFDQKDEIIVDELKVGDSIIVDALSFYPAKHRIKEINRDLSKSSEYNPEDGFNTEYHMHINQFEDYYGANNQEYKSKDGKVFYYSAVNTHPSSKLVGDILDKIKFNQGSLIEKSIIRQNKDSLIVKQIYFYLNKFSLDAEPLKVLKKEFTAAFPNQVIVCSVLDKSNPKHERFLK